jgi:hypothetical protein
MAIADEIREYMGKYPDACVGELAAALKCSEQSIRRRSAEIGLKPRRTTPERMAEAARRMAEARGLTADSVRDVVRSMIETESANIIAQILARADAKVPTKEQVAEVLESTAGHHIVAEALRMHGSATLRSALQHNKCQPIRVAINAGEDDKLIPGSAIQARMRLLFGRGGVDCLDAFMRLIEIGGREKLIAWIKSELKEPAA